MVPMLGVVRQVLVRVTGAEMTPPLVDLLVEAGVMVVEALADLRPEPLMLISMPKENPLRQEVKVMAARMAVTARERIRTAHGVPTGANSWPATMRRKPRGWAATPTRRRSPKACSNSRTR